MNFFCAGDRNVDWAANNGDESVSSASWASAATASSNSDVGGYTTVLTCDGAAGPMGRAAGRQQRRPLQQ